MSTVNLTLTPAAFSVNGAWTVEQFHQALAASLNVATTSASVVLGRAGGIAPVTDIGPWLNGTTWYAWNGSSYVPATIKIGNATNQITLTGTPTANRVITFPDASGTVALTSDINRATVYPTVSATTTLDWSLSNSFGIPLDKNITIANANSLSGQEIQFAIYNPSGASWTVTWGGDVQWGGGAAPVQTTNDALDMYWLRNMGGNIYGRAVQDY